MSLKANFSGDLAPLPTNAFGHRSLTWWSNIGFMVFEGAAFAVAAAAYFILLNQEGDWPPGPVPPPDLVAGTCFTLIMLLSEVPNIVIKKAAEEQRLGAVQFGLLLMSSIGVPLFVLRTLEFGSLNVFWYETPMLR